MDGVVSFVMAVMAAKPRGGSGGDVVAGGTCQKPPEPTLRSAYNVSGEAKLHLGSHEACDAAG